jgi:hypothetical protein
MCVCARASVCVCVCVYVCVCVCVCKPGDRLKSTFFSLDWHVKERRRASTLPHGLGCVGQMLRDKERVVTVIRVLARRLVE